MADYQTRNADAGGPQDWPSNALGSERRKGSLEALRAQPLLVVPAGLLATVGFIVFLVGMAKAGAGVVITLRNTSVLFAQVFAFTMGERPKRLGVVGALCVTFGAVLLSR